MRKKIIAFVLLTIVMLYASVDKVRAYQVVNSFKKGDMITALVSCDEEGKDGVKCNTKEFVLVKDNITDFKNEDWLDIYTISKDYMGEPVEFSKINDELTNLKEESNQENEYFSYTGEFLKITDIVDNFDGKETEITSSTWAKSDFPYWVEDESGGKYYVEGSKIKIADENTKAYIRPIVNHEISSVKNAMVKPNSWREFNEIIKCHLVTANDDLNNIVYEYDDTSLTLKENDSYSRYSFDGTTLKFDSSSQDKSSTIPEYISAILAYDLFTDSHKLRSIDNKLIGEYFKFDSENPETFSINLAYYYGWKQTDAVNDNIVQTPVIKNPKTGDKKLNFVICISVLLTGVLIYSVRKLKKLN